MPKKPHYQGSYHVQSRKVREAANADPATRCWRCRRTLAEIRLTNPRARWTAGHLIDGQPEGQLAPECSVCNYREGGRLGGLRRTRRSPLTW